jgi:hypothetical protein
VNEDEGKDKTTTTIRWVEQDVFVVVGWGWHDSGPIRKEGSIDSKRGNIK